MMEKRTPLLQYRPACAAALAFGAALLLCRCAALSRPTCFALGACMLALGLCALPLRRARLAGVLLALALGALRMGLATPPDMPEGVFSVAGAVSGVPEREADGRYAIRLANVTLDGAPAEGRVQVLLDTPAAPVHGQRVTLTAVLSRPQPWQSDSARYLRVGAFAVPARDDYRCEPPVPSLIGALGVLRERAAERIRALFPEHGTAAAAMLLGGQEGLDQETREAFRASGMSHLLAVSGLHVSVLAGVAYAFIRVPRPWVRFGAIAVLLLGYAALTAFTPSVLRASCMFLIGAAASPLCERPDRASSLAAAFLLVLLGNPYALFRAGFQLSFLAVYGLITLAPALSGLCGAQKNASSDLLFAGVGAVAATLPVVAGCFGEVPAFGLLANLIVLPLFPLFLVPAALAVLLSCVSMTAGMALARLAAFPLRLMLSVLARCEGGVLPIHAPSAPAFMLWLVALLFASPYVLRERKTRALYVLACAAGALLVWRL